MCAPGAPPRRIAGASSSVRLDLEPPAMRKLIAPFVATALTVMAPTHAASAPAGPLPDIVMDGTNLYPESMSSAPDGSVYIGSMKGIVFRARPGSNRATAWIKPTARNGILTLLGVLVDAPSHTLW